MADVEPCKMCGSRVRIQRKNEPTLAGDNFYEVRVCTNRECGSNRGMMSLADEV